MDLIDATHTHPIVPRQDAPPAPSPGTTIVPTAAPTTTWKGKVPVAPVEMVRGSNAIAQIIEGASVEPSHETLCVSPVGAFLENVLCRPPQIEAASAETFTHTEYSSGIRSNMLLSAADACFQAHVPLGLRPEVIWATIATQIAIEVTENAELYRSMFTTSDEKQTIRVMNNDLRIGSPYGWDQTIGMFDAPLRELIPSTVMDVCVPNDLTTCGATENIANLVVFMKTASPYYDYEVETMCGIPHIALYGAPEDWSKLVERLDRLAHLFPNLSEYFDVIRPILRQIAVSAHGGEAPTGFWESIYKRNSESGGDKLTGWLTTFFLYLTGDYGLWKRRDFEWEQQWGGIEPAAFPGSVAVTDFKWIYFAVELPMQLCGGILTTTYDDGFLTPRLGWAIVHK